MKKYLRAALLVVLAVVGSIVVHEHKAISAAVYNFIADGRVWVFDGGLEFGRKARRGTVINIGKDSFDSTVATQGTWSALSAARSTSEKFSCTGAIVGNHAVPIFGAAVSATFQQLAYGCSVVSTNTCGLLVSNITAATITPKTGPRGCNFEGQ